MSFFVRSFFVTQRNDVKSSALIACVCFVYMNLFGCLQKENRAQFVMSFHESQRPPFLNKTILRVPISFQRTVQLPQCKWADYWSLVRGDVYSFLVLFLFSGILIHLRLNRMCVCESASRMSYFYFPIFLVVKTNKKNEEKKKNKFPLRSTYYWKYLRYNWHISVCLF